MWTEHSKAWFYCYIEASKVVPHEYLCLSTTIHVANISSNSPEEIDISEFLHLFNICCLYDFFVIEKHP